jgi:hypothetical protein
MQTAKNAGYYISYVTQVSRVCWAGSWVHFWLFSVRQGKKNERFCRGDRTFHFPAANQGWAENPNLPDSPATVKFRVATYLAGCTGYPSQPSGFKRALD